MKTPCNKAMQPQQVANQSAAPTPCPHCKGKKFILRGKTRISCLHCNATGLAASGYKTK